MPLLVDRLGDANDRVDKMARDALLNFARCQHVGAAFTAQYLLKSPEKKSAAAVHARVFSSRLQVLTALASDFGVQPECPEGVPLESTVKLAMECFTHKEGDVRENSVKLVAACYMHVGLRRIAGYLSNLRPAQREVFNAEFERVAPSIILEFDTKSSGKPENTELDTEVDTSTSLRIQLFEAPLGIVFPNTAPLTVSRLQPGSAEKAGVRVDWLIKSVNGQSLEGLDYNGALEVVKAAVVRLPRMSKLPGAVLQKGD
jgi:hypothetical protein